MKYKYTIYSQNAPEVTFHTDESWEIDVVYERIKINKPITIERDEKEGRREITLFPEHITMIQVFVREDS